MARCKRQLEINAGITGHLSERQIARGGRKCREISGDVVRRSGREDERVPALDIRRGSCFYLIAGAHDDRHTGKRQVTARGATRDVTPRVRLRTG